VFPKSHIQQDYFHILQNIWRKVWGVTLAYRQDLKTRGEEAETPWYSRRLLRQAAQLWKNPYIFFHYRRESEGGPETDDEGGSGLSAPNVIPPWLPGEGLSHLRGPID